MFFNLFNKKKKILLLNEKWVTMDEYSVDIIPKRYELIYLHKEGKYFEVLNLIHNLHHIPSVILIVKEYSIPS